METTQSQSFKQRLQDALTKGTAGRNLAMTINNKIYICQKCYNKKIKLIPSICLNLPQAFNYLLTIPHTSVVVEILFSAAGFIYNKIRSNLADNTLNQLIFLRLFFKPKTNIFVSFTNTFRYFIALQLAFA